MASFTTPVSNTTQGFVPMNPAPNPQQQMSFSSKFLKGEPKALGTVQIMIGIVILAFGSVLFISGESFLIPVGIIYWESVTCILTGAMSVASVNKISFGLIKCSLVMNVISAITSFILIVMLSMEVAVRHFSCRDYVHRPHCSNQSLSQGVTAVLLIFTVLIFIVFICISAFACKATCGNNNHSGVVYVVSDQTSGTTVPSVPCSAIQTTPNAGQQMLSTVQVMPGTVQNMQSNIQYVPNTFQSIPNNVQYMPNTVQYMLSTVQATQSNVQATQGDVQATQSAPPPYNDVKA